MKNKDKHLYRIDTNAAGSEYVEYVAYSRGSARKMAEAAGYRVWSVNMIG